MNRTSKATASLLLATALVFGTGACDDDDGDVTGTNLPPVAQAGADATFQDIDGNGSEQVSLDGSASSDPDGTIQVFRWREAGDVIAGGPTATPVLTVGTHVITLEVVDDEGASDTDDVTITVEEAAVNQPPVADAGVDQTVTDLDGDGEALVTLDGTASTDADGEITFFEWSEGGTVIATGAISQVSLPVGVHTILLTVTDDLIATDTDEVVVTVEAQPL